MNESAKFVRARARALIYWAVGVGITLVYIALRGSTWSGDAQLHTLMETVATMLAMIVGVMALVRFYSKKNDTILFIGAGFLGTAFLDGYHSMVTSSFFAPYLPSDLPSLIPWSWVASRQFLSIMLLLSWLAWMREQRLGAAGRIDERTVYVGTALLTLACFLFFAIVPLPPAYYPELIFPRPEEFGPALFFLIALVGYLRKGAWREDAFEHWLVLSLIVGFVGQAVFMSYSGELFDLEFDAAHLLKKVSYICVLTGLLINMQAVFRRSEDSEIRIRTIVDNVLEGIVTIDERGVVLTFNQASEKIFGYAAGEVTGRNVKMLMAGAFHDGHDQYLRNFMTTGDAKIIGKGREVEGQRKNGEMFPMDLGVAEMRVGGQRIFVGNCRDITERKRTEREIGERTAQLEAANAELDAFAYSVSHDLRAPLRAMSGFARALEEDHGSRLDGEALDFLKRIVAASRRMGQMIDDILALSRASRGEVRRARVDLSELAETTLALLRESEPDRKVSVVIEPAIVVRGDGRMLDLVLQNLLANAWKFTHNSANATVEFNTFSRDGERIFFVRDNGAGFDMAYVGKLFGIFQRLHAADEFEGTGIGLATVARLIGRHGGRVWAEGAEGEGATFYFTLGPENMHGSLE